MNEFAFEAEHVQIDLLGGGDLKIRDFYVMPRVVGFGRRATMCYSVVGAKIVRIDPPVQELHPALSYCFQIVAKQTTEYRLLAQDEAGHTATAKVTLKVIQQGESGVSK